MQYYVALQVLLHIPQYSYLFPNDHFYANLTMPYLFC